METFSTSLLADSTLEGPDAVFELPKCRRELVGDVGEQRPELVFRILQNVVEAVASVVTVDAEGRVLLLERLNARPEAIKLLPAKLMQLLKPVRRLQHLYKGDPIDRNRRRETKGIRNTRNDGI